MDIAIPPLDEDNQAIGIQYCTGYVDKNSNWKPGFYCPPQTKGQNVYCCGTSTHKYCCTQKEIANGGSSSTLSTFVSSATLFSVVIVTFLLAVMLTVLTFMLCKKYWKKGVEIRETHLYRMSSCSTNNNENSTSGFQQLNPSSLLSGGSNTHFINNPLVVPQTPYETYLAPNQYSERHQMAFLEPPPPYHQLSTLSSNGSTSNNNNIGSNTGNNNGSNVGGSSSNNGRLFSVLTTPCRRDAVFPYDGRKRLWRTLSQ